MIIKLKTAADKKEWHRYFTWKPLRIDGYFIWLRFVERREFFQGAYGYAEYRLIKKLNDKTSIDV